MNRIDRRDILFSNAANLLEVQNLVPPCAAIIINCERKLPKCDPNSPALKQTTEAEMSTIEKQNVPGGGLEPPTRGFSVLCSTN